MPAIKDLPPSAQLAAKKAAGCYNWAFWAFFSLIVCEIFGHKVLWGLQPWTNPWLFWWQNLSFFWFIAALGMAGAHKNAAFAHWEAIAMTDYFRREMVERNREK